MKFITRSGSVYEINLEKTKVRRLEGKENPTPRQGPDGEWKEAESISDPVIGKPVFIFWDPKTTPPKREGAIPATMTSNVVEVVLD